MAVKPTSRESAVENELERRVEAAGGFTVKVRAIGRRGFFDRLVLLPIGRVILVELKRPKGGRLSAHQIKCHATYRSLGAEVAVVRNSADIDALMTRK